MSSDSVTTKNMGTKEKRKGLPRWLWEALILLVIAAVGYGVWWWLGIEHRADLQAQKDQLTTEHQAELKKAKQAVAAALSSEATAAAVAFSSGIGALVAEERWQDVDEAALQLLELPGVAFVHVLAPDGTVRVSSDRKLLATGRAGPRAKWALESDGVVQRAGQLETLEVALPFRAESAREESAGEKLAVLWLGYRSPLS